MLIESFFTTPNLYLIQYHLDDNGNRKNVKYFFVSSRIRSGYGFWGFVTDIREAIPFRRMEDAEGWKESFISEFGQARYAVIDVD